MKLQWLSNVYCLEMCCYTASLCQISFLMFAPELPEVVTAAYQLLMLCSPILFFTVFFFLILEKVFISVVFDLAAQLYTSGPSATIAIVECRFLGELYL